LESRVTVGLSDTYRYRDMPLNVDKATGIWAFFRAIGNSG